MKDAPLTRAIVLLASTFIVIAGLKIAQPILLPIFVAIFLSVITSPMVSSLVKLKLPIGLAITIVVIGLFGFFYGLGRLLITSTDEFILNLPGYQEQIQEWLVTIQNQAPWLVNQAKIQISTLQPTERALSMIGALFSGLGSALTTLVLIVFTLIFTLYEAQNVSRKARLIFGEANTLDYVKKFSSMVQKYLLVKSLVSVATGILVGLFLLIVGVDYPVLWGTIAFLMNFIPNIGSLLAAIPPVIIGGIQFGISGFLITSAGFIAVNTIIGNLVEPKLMGKTLDISPLIVFLSLIFWGWVFGPIGMLLSIPLTVTLKIGLEVYPPTKWLAHIISQ